MAKLFFLEELEELFTTVQISGIFADQKVFADSIPNAPAATILKAYRKQKQENDFDLSAFVATYFQVPSYNETNFISDISLTARQHIEQLWDVLTINSNTSKGTVIGLPFSYVVPGGRFRELFYWDSYFTMLGLQASGKMLLVQNMVNNFAYLLNTFGHIPNGTKTYFLSRSQPPFFSLMIDLLSEDKGDEVYPKYLPQLTAEYNFWMQDSALLNSNNSKRKRVMLMPDGSILNRYWDEKDMPREEGYAEDIVIAQRATAKKNDVYRNIRAACESGWDFSGRWFINENDISTVNTTDIIPVDLNCLLLHLEKALQYTHALLKNTTEAEAYADKAASRNAAIQKYLWSNAQQTFCDYLYSQNSCSVYLSTAMLFPLFMNIATGAQAAAVLKLTEERFLQPGGLLTTLYYTGQQWDAPNGWAPLQWIGFKAAINYGNHKLAENIKHNWVTNVERVYKSSGKMMEKYNVVDISKEAGGGEYPNQDGFGWTNGVYLKFIAHQ